MQMSLNLTRPYNANLSRFQSSLMEYDAIEERQLLKKVRELLAGYTNSEWFTRKWCRALGYFEAVVLASRPGIDGAIIDTPKTASVFMRNLFVDTIGMASFVFMPIKPGDYLTQVEPSVPRPPLQVYNGLSVSYVRDEKIDKGWNLGEAYGMLLECLWNPCYLIPTTDVVL
uniref:SHV3-like 5 n=1 Tax=Tanacetum cinerariifolium TaxID=118510 RepID=A0A699HMW6_TANCI|nr:SHV3-like 5 [Tanacetum cinerariifolium]